jgi:hypothetical protein
MALELAQLLFSTANTIALLGWLALLVVPLRYRMPRALALVIAVLAAMLYAALMGVLFLGSDGGFGSLDEVANLFDEPGLLLAGWVHYLAFDLLVGVWERDEARRSSLPQWLLAPCLVLTFLFGPLGWLCFLAVRLVHRRGVTQASTAIP